MRNLYTIVFLLSILPLLISCQHSPQKSYYLLTPLAPQTETKSASISHLIGLGPVELADYLERSNMVRMYPDNSLNLNSNDFWGEPLGKGIVRVLSLNLTRQDPTRMIQPFPWRSDRIPPHSLRVTIHELVLINGQAKINATWELVNTSDKRTIERQHFIRTLETNNKGQNMAYAYSQLLAELAKEMNSALLKAAH